MNFLVWGNIQECDECLKRNNLLKCWECRKCGHYRADGWTRSFQQQSSYVGRGRHQKHSAALTDAMDYGVIKKHVEAAMHDIMTREQVGAAKHDILTRLVPKDKITEKLNDCGNGPQHSPEYDELTHCVDYSHPNNDGEYRPTAEVSYFYGW